MNIPLKITFRNMPPSKAIEDNVREKAAKLDSFSDRIMSCRVIVEAPHRHHHKGKAYEVRIDLTVPGAELVINRAPKRLAAAKLELASDEKALAESHEPSKHAAHEDVYVAIRDAFNAAVRLKSPELTTHSLDGPSSHSFLCSGGIAAISHSGNLAMNSSMLQRRSAPCRNCERCKSEGV